VEVALEYGAKKAYLIDYASEAKDEWLIGVKTVGLTSGASVPEILVRTGLDWLSLHGYSNVEEVRATEETLLFSLPPELRKDLKAMGK
jgi:4-hydroxy-3-methylbut-2-enyl diphosphate reductase